MDETKKEGTQNPQRSREKVAEGVGHQFLLPL
jgi:hypothetical protein